MDKKATGEAIACFNKVGYVMRREQHGLRRLQSGLLGLIFISFLGRP